MVYGTTNVKMSKKISFVKLLLCTKSFQLFENYLILLIIYNKYIQNKHVFDILKFSIIHYNAKEHLNVHRTLYKLEKFTHITIYGQVHRLLSITCPTESQPLHEQKQLIKNHPIIRTQSKWQ